MQSTSSPLRVWAGRLPFNRASDEPPRRNSGRDELPVCDFVCSFETSPEDPNGSFQVDTVYTVLTSRKPISVYLPILQIQRGFYFHVEVLFRKWDLRMSPREVP